MKEDIKNLLKKQEDEFLKIKIGKDLFNGHTIYRNQDEKTILDFIKKVRKETAEAVCDEMTEKEKEIKNEIKGSTLRAFKQILDQQRDSGYNDRIKEEKGIKKQIIKEL